MVVTSAGDQEYLLERKLDSVLTTLPDMASLEAIGNGRKVDECLKKDDEKIGQSHLCAATTRVLWTVWRGSEGTNFLF